MAPGKPAATSGRPPHVLRLATWNVEWFSHLFDRDDRLLPDDGPSGREGVTRGDQLAALGIVFTAMDADAVLIVEAPDTNHRRSTVRALEAFAAWAGLRTRAVLMGFANGTEQEIALLYDPAVIAARHDPMGDPTGRHEAHDAPRFDTEFRWDLDADERPETITFSKPPLEAAVTHLPTGFGFRLIGVHVKSKAPHGAKRPEEVTRIAIENRRKQMAQCIWLRRRAEGHLAAGESLLVLGDFNDGPGLDEYERLFGRSGVEVVMGSGHDDIPDAEAGMMLYDPHARLALTRRGGATPATARFYIPDEDRYLSALLDYIMVSPDLRAMNPSWRIWHPFDDPACYRTPELREALLAASDHFPVTLDIALPS
jgi:hypothetical protein